MKNPSATGTDPRSRAGVLLRWVPSAARGCARRLCARDSQGLLLTGPFLSARLSSFLDSLR